MTPELTPPVRPIVSGKAVVKTGTLFKEKILDYASYMLKRPMDTLDVKENCVVDRESGEVLLSMEELATTRSTAWTAPYILRRKPPAL